MKIDVLSRLNFQLSSIMYMVACHFSCRVRKSKELDVVDVDGSYLYRKHQSLQSMGMSVVPLPLPCVSLRGWEQVNEGNYTAMALCDTWCIFCRPFELNYNLL